MSVSVEALFTSALGLKSPWEVVKVELDTAKRPRRSRLEPFSKLAATLRERLIAVVRGILDGRSNANIVTMNGMLQQN